MTDILTLPVVDKQKAMAKEELYYNNKMVEKVANYYDIAKRGKEKSCMQFANLFLEYFKGEQFKKMEEHTIIFNNITPGIVGSLSDLTSADVSIELIPTSMADKPKVKQLEKIINLYWNNRLNMQQELLQLFQYAKIYGTGFLYPHLEQANGMPELAINAIDPRLIFPDPTAKKDEELEFIVYSNIISLNKLRRAYPITGLMVAPEVFRDEELQLSSFAGFLKDGRQPGVIMPSGIVRHSSDSKTTGSAGMEQVRLTALYLKDDSNLEYVESEYRCYCSTCAGTGKGSFSVYANSPEDIYCPNCHSLIPFGNTMVKNNTRKARLQYPYGRVMVMANGVLLDDKPNKYLGFPFPSIKNIDVTDFWGMGDVQLLIGMQFNINNQLSDINKQNKRMLDPDIICDDNSEIKREGRFIKKRPGTTATWLEAPAPSSTAWNLVEMYIRQMDNLSGLMDRSRVKTASESLLLNTAEERRQGALIRSLEGKFKVIINQMLHILTNYHTLTEQMALEQGKDEYVLFKGTDYKGLLFDVQVKITPSNTATRTIMNQQALQLLQSQVIDRNMFLKLYDFPFKEEVVGEIEKQPMVTENQD